MNLSKRQYETFGAAKIRASTTSVLRYSISVLPEIHLWQPFAQASHQAAAAASALDPSVIEPKPSIDRVDLSAFNFVFFLAKKPVKK